MGEVARGLVRLFFARPMGCRLRRRNAASSSDSHLT
jgi:hypothetical protein